MSTTEFNWNNITLPKEGTLYKRIAVSDKVFDIYYGYYEDFEREFNDPIPLYPDLLRIPEYTSSGELIVTGMQDICSNYSGRESGDSCAGCLYFKSCEDLFGICTCLQNRKKL